MEVLALAALTPEAGIEGDARGRPGPRQVTVLSAEAWTAAQAELGGEPSPWTLRRANLLVAGIALPRAEGARLRVGGAVLEVTGECDPCRVMDLQRPGLRAALTPGWRGGATCRVLTGALLRLGDPVTAA
jgi:MOSC domain-containing protein YiiM